MLTLTYLYVILCLAIAKERTMAKDKHTFSVLMLKDWINRLKEIGAKQDRSVNYLILKAVDQVYKLSGDSA